MKTCKKCGSQWPDNQKFCAKCGNTLVSASTPAPYSGGGNPIDNYFGNPQDYRNELERIYKEHGALIMGILAIICAKWLWYFSGLIVGGLGLYCGKFEKSQPLRILGYVLNAIGVLIELDYLLGHFA